MGADHSTAPFVGLADLASARVGGRALAANDEFFAPKSNLVKPQPAIFVPGKFTTRGKWMDGWESRRRRTPGHDWCIVLLGMRGVIRGVNVDTSHFTGNHPSHCSIDAIDSPRAAHRGGSRGRGSAVDVHPARVAASRRCPESPGRRGRPAVDARAAEHLSGRRRGAPARLRRGRRRLAGRGARRAAGRSGVDSPRRPRARRERHALRRQGQHDHAGPREEHGRRMGNAPPPRPRARLGDRPPRNAGLVDAHRDRHQPFQGELSRERLARRLFRAGRAARRAEGRLVARGSCRRTKLRPHHRHFLTPQSGIAGLARAPQHFS